MALIFSMPSCYAENVSVDKITPKTKTEKQTEFSSIINKFAKSMALVIGSCICIYGLLLFYKRFKTNNNKNNEESCLAKNLNSPETTDEAIKFVIEKF